VNSKDLTRSATHGSPKHLSREDSQTLRPDWRYHEPVRADLGSNLPTHSLWIGHHPARNPQGSRRSGPGQGLVDHVHRGVVWLHPRRKGTAPPCWISTSHAILSLELKSRNPRRSRLHTPGRRTPSRARVPGAARNVRWLPDPRSGRQARWCTPDVGS